MSAGTSMPLPPARAGGRGSTFLLSLADGTRLALSAGDETAAPVVGFLSRAARLVPAPHPLPPATRRLLVVAAPEEEAASLAQGSDAVDDADVVFRLEPTRTPQPWRGLGSPSAGREPLTAEQWLCQQVVRLSTCISRESLPRGGALLHSGLALLPPSLAPAGSGPGEERGVLLAGRSGVGKSTAARRLPPPWRALADEATLVVGGEKGTYWAHPWPTWSRFFGAGKGDGRDAWDVQRAVPLRAIFVLEQGEEDHLAPLGPGQAVALLAELALQTATHFFRGLPHDEIVAFNRQRFENLCALVRCVPAYLLHVSLTGTFWEEALRASESVG